MPYLMMCLSSLSSIIIGSILFYKLSSKWAYLYFPLSIFFGSLFLYWLMMVVILKSGIQVAGIEKDHLEQSLGVSMILIYPIFLTPLTIISTFIFWFMRK